MNLPKNHDTVINSERHFCLWGVWRIHIWMSLSVCRNLIWSGHNIQCFHFPVCTLCACNQRLLMTNRTLMLRQQWYATSVTSLQQPADFSAHRREGSRRIRAMIICGALCVHLIWKVVNYLASVMRNCHRIITNMTFMGIWKIIAV